TVDDLLRDFRPGAVRYDKAFRSIRRPNKAVTIEVRTRAVAGNLGRSLWYLAGVMTVMPLFKIQSSALKHDAEKLLEYGVEIVREADDPHRSKKPGSAFIKRAQKHQDKIQRLIDRITKQEGV